MFYYLRVFLGIETVAVDGKDTHRLKLDKIGPICPSFNAMVGKIIKN